MDVSQLPSRYANAITALAGLYSTGQQCISQATFSSTTQLTMQADLHLFEGIMIDADAIVRSGANILLQPKIASLATEVASIDRVTQLKIYVRRNRFAAIVVVVLMVLGAILGVFQQCHVLFSHQPSSPFPPTAPDPSARMKESLKVNGDSLRELGEASSDRLLSDHLDDLISEAQPDPDRLRHAVDTVSQTGDFNEVIHIIDGAAADRVAKAGTQREKAIEGCQIAGTVAFMAGDNAKASLWAAQLLSLSPNDWRARQLEIAIAIRQCRLDDAERACLAITDHETTRIRAESLVLRARIAGLRGDLVAAEELNRTAFSAYSQLGDNVAMAQCLLAMGRIAASTQSFSAAETILNEAHARSQIASNSRGEILTDLALANLSSRHGDFESAIEKARVVLSKVATDLDLELRAASHTELGQIYQRNAESLQHDGLQDEALSLLGLAAEQHKRALDIATQIHHRAGEVCEGGNLGAVYSRRYFITGADADLKTAIEYTARALERAKECGLVDYEATGCANLAALFGMQGELDAADELLLRAFVIHDKNGDKLSQAYVASNLGEVCNRRGRLDDAVTWWTLSAQLFREMGDNDHAQFVEGVIQKAQSGIIEDDR